MSQSQLITRSLIRSRQGVLRYLIAGAAVALMTAVIDMLRVGTFANACMLYLLVVMFIALILGSVPAVVASVLSLLAFDWFFVEPVHTFTVRDPSEWLALCMFLLVSIIVGQLTAMLKQQAEEAHHRELEAVALAEAGWAVVSEVESSRALANILAHICRVAGFTHAVLFKAVNPDCYEVAAQLKATGSEEPDTFSSEAIKFVHDRAREISLEAMPHWDKALASHATAGSYLPVCIEHKVIGILYWKVVSGQRVSVNERRIVESLLNCAAVVMQRDNLMKIQAKAQALAEADRLKTALLSMVSHDFRSPLTSIKASVGSLLSTGTVMEIDTQRSLLHAIEGETDRLNRMVGNILDLSRLEAGAWRPHREMTALDELIGAALDCFDKEDDARIDVNLNTDLRDVWVDSVQIVQVLKNLLENALKYSPPGSKVELAMGLEASNLIIEVSDSGAGLPAGEEAQIFEPFYRAASVKESSLPGMGAGLAICRGLVEAHGGSLTARNRSTHGAVFRVTLPITAPDERVTQVGSSEMRVIDG